MVYKYEITLYPEKKPPRYKILYKRNDHLVDIFGESLKDKYKSISAAELILLMEVAKDLDTHYKLVSSLGDKVTDILVIHYSPNLDISSDFKSMCERNNFILKTKSIDPGKEVKLGEDIILLEI